jgi:HEAT repeat protein
MPTRTPSQTPLLNLLLAFSVSAAMLSLGEGAARLLEHRLPDPEGDRLALWEKEWGDDFYLLRSLSPGWPPGEPLNRDGLPDRRHASEKPEGVFRLAVLGDSVTAGTPFKPEESFPVQLQSLYDERTPWVEVFSAALWGWSTRQERYAFERIVRGYGPDVVLLAVCLNDMEELQNNLARPPALLGWLHRRSALVRRVVAADARSIRQVQELLTDSKNARRAYERFFGELERLHAEVERSPGARLVVMLLPMQAQAAGESGSRLPQQQVAAFCARLGLPFLDPLAALSELGAAGFEDIVHLSLAGRARVARYLLESDVVPEQAAATAAARSHLGAQAAHVPVRRLLAALTSDDPRLRAEAAWLLGRRGDAARAGGPELLRALDDPSEPVRAEAARAIGRLGHAAAAEAGGLTRALNDPRQGVRWRAIEALVALRPASDAAIGGLAAALEHPDSYVRAGAAWCLHEIGDRAAPARPGLRRLLGDPEPGVGIVAARALAAVSGDAETVAALTATVRDAGNDELRWQAARALGRLGPMAVSGAGTLIDALRHPNGHVRREAATALGRIRPSDPAVVTSLVAATRDDWAPVRLAAAMALGRLGAPGGARPALERLLADGDADVRAAARRALEKSPHAPQDSPAGP